LAVLVGHQEEVGRVGRVDGDGGVELVARLAADIDGRAHGRGVVREYPRVIRAGDYPRPVVEDQAVFQDFEAGADAPVLPGCQSLVAGFFEGGDEFQ
jgi:hypothetical protein